MREHNQRTWVLFLDLVKAFDRVPRELLWMVLDRFGVPPKLLSIIKSLHETINVKFTVDSVSHVLDCRIGVKQGDVLGPILFSIYIAAIMITWRQDRNHPQCLFRTKEDSTLTGRRSNAKGDDFVLGDSEYADDTAALFDSRESVVTDAPRVNIHFDRYGMEIHAGIYALADKASRTEILLVIRRDDQQPTELDHEPVSLNDEKFFPIVDKFSYLGSIITNDCSDREDVLSRIKKAGNMFGSLRKCLFGNVNIHFKIKGKVYESLVLSILLYGSES